MTDEEQVLAEITRMLVAIIGEDYILGLDIGMSTSFDADLELESIEFVRLAAKLTEHYGERVNFITFLATKEMNEITALTVGAVVNHVTECMTISTAGAGGIRG